MWLDCASLNETIRRASVESVRRAYELADPLRVDAWILHLWGSTTIQISELMQESVRRRMFLGAVLEQAEKSLEQIKEFINPFNLCVETLEAPEFDFIIPSLQKNNVQICLDVGHLAWQGGGNSVFWSVISNKSAKSICMTPGWKKLGERERYSTIWHWEKVRSITGTSCKNLPI